MEILLQSLQEQIKNNAIQKNPAFQYIDGIELVPNILNEFTLEKWRQEKR